MLDLKKAVLWKCANAGINNPPHQITTADTHLKQNVFLQGLNLGTPVHKAQNLSYKATILGYGWHSKQCQVPVCMSSRAAILKCIYENYEAQSPRVLDNRRQSNITNIFQVSSGAGCPYRQTRQLLLAPR